MVSLRLEKAARDWLAAFVEIQTRRVSRRTR
jgi:hypothetical protein